MFSWIVRLCYCDIRDGFNNGLDLFCRILLIY